jgi:hypothetical protein
MAVDGLQAAHFDLVATDKWCDAGKVSIMLAATT